MRIDFTVVLLSQTQIGPEHGATSDSAQATIAKYMTPRRRVGFLPADGRVRQGGICPIAASWSAGVVSCDRDYQAERRL